MKRTIAILLLLLLLPCLALGTDSVPDAVLDACESVLRVEVKVGEDTYTGSAFIIQTAHDGTLLVTNEHVVADWDEVSVWRDSKTKEKVDVLVENEQYDLAILYCGKPLDALFIDEGFGSLSDGVLDKALDVLNQLTEGERLVGIISHVDKLGESIPQKIRVKNTDRGSRLFLELA